MLKSYRVGWGGGGDVVGWVAHEILVSAQGPLVLGFWVFGLRVWGQGLTIIVGPMSSNSNKCTSDNV